MIKRYCLILLFLSCLNLPGVYAQQPKNIHFFNVKKPIKIDGIFEPTTWAGADSAVNFTQMEPTPGDPSTERTVAYIGYDDKNIYAIFQCFQTFPISGENQSRDDLNKSDDLVAVILDTYKDDRSGYSFITNPLGTQHDTRINDDGRNMDDNWDAEWECESKVYDWGWCAEFKIPFKSLKYKKGLNIWGINFARAISSNLETVYWSGTLSDDYRISQGGKALGVVTPGSNMKLSIFPYISIFKTTGKRVSADVGGDIQWQVTPNISVNSTINPDFATVEADQQKINLTRYELRYPEKRLFFQEGNDMYSTRIKTFYSRRIQDIDFGTRANGKIGKTQFNILNVISPRISDSPTSVFTAARFKYDFLKSSTLGLTLVDKSWNDGFTRSVSLDYLMNLGKTWKLTGQFVGSAPGNFWNHSAFFVRFARENNIYHYHVRYTELGENFRDNVDQTGFITDDDRREVDSDVTYKFWLKNNTFEYIHLKSKNNIFWSRNGTLRSWYVTQSANFYFKNNFNIEYAYNDEYKLYEKDFYNHKHIFSLGYNTESWSHAQVSYTTGRNFDRDFSLISFGGRVKLFQKLSLSYSANVLDFSPDPDDNSTFINVLTANYNFTKDLWLKVFTQNNTVKENTYFYGLFGWRFKPPFGALYIIYSHDEYLEKANTPNSSSLFLKLTYPISILK